MTNLSNWTVNIEYGPGASDVHEIVVRAASLKGALIKAEKWAKDNSIDSPMFGIPYQEHFDDESDWDTDDTDVFYGFGTHNIYDER